MRTPHDLEVYCQEHGIQASVLHLETPTPTVPAAAAAVGCEPHQVAKSVLFLVDGEPLLVIAGGVHLVDRRVLASLYGVGKKRVRLASASQVLEITGYPAGALPPFGHRQPLPVYMDRSLLANPIVYAGGGSESALLRISPGTILDATGAHLLDLIVHEQVTLSEG